MKKDLVFQLERPQRIVLRKGGSIILLRYDEIDWLEARGKYTCFHVGNQLHTVNDNISDVEQRLDTKYFIRIHRSAIVNIHRIREIRSWFRGEYKVVLLDGTELKCSRSYRDNLHRLMEMQYEPNDVPLSQLSTHRM